MRRRLAAWGENFGLLEPDPSGQGGYSAAGWAARGRNAVLGAADYVRQGAEGSGEERERGLEEVKDEELYVMPGWGVVRYRDEKVAKGAPGFAALPGLVSNPEDQPMGPIPTAVGMALLEEADDSVHGDHQSHAERRHQRHLAAQASPSGARTPVSARSDAQEAEKGSGEGQVGYGVYQSRRRRPAPLTSSSASSAVPPANAGDGSADSSGPTTPTASASANTPPQPPSSRPTAARPPPSRANSTFSISSTTSTTTTAEAAFVGPEAIASAHETLQRRIAPFWSSILPNRRVLVDIYAVPPDEVRERKEGLARREGGLEVNDGRYGYEYAQEGTEKGMGRDKAEPLTSFEIITDSNGHFSKVITIPWETICTSPAAVPMAFEVDESKRLAWDLRVRTRLDYEVFEYGDGDGASTARGATTGGGGGGGGGYRERIKRAMATYGVDANDDPTTASPPSGASVTPRSMPPRPDTAATDAGEFTPAASPPSRDSAGSDNGPAAAGSEQRAEEAERAIQRLSLNTPGEPQVIVNTMVRLGSAGGVHIISDLDDTVKHSDILSGPREVFRNVFCRPLEDIVVPEMNEMYRRLNDRGIAGFHFVSNSPSQLFPSIRRFLTVNEFPDRHSIKLKYYGGRSIFSSLYESPAERKRASLRELFEAFPQARFIMLGDSAEQDLELYIEFSRLYKGQVALIAVRDVTSDRADLVLQGIQGLPAMAQAMNSPLAGPGGLVVDGDRTPGVGAGAGGDGGLGAGAKGKQMPGGLEDVAATPVPTLGAGRENGSVKRMAEQADASLHSAHPTSSSGSASTPTSTSTATTPRSSSSTVIHNPANAQARPATHPRPPNLRTSSSASSLMAEVSEDDLRSLSSSQQKILQRAATWQTRMNQAYATVPEGTGLVFFKQAYEVEGRIEEVLDGQVEREREQVR